MHAFDRQTDRNLIVRPRLHSMQRGKNKMLSGNQMVLPQNKVLSLKIKTTRKVINNSVAETSPPTNIILQPKSSRNAALLQSAIPGK